MLLIYNLISNTSYFVAIRKPHDINTQYTTFLHT